MIYHDEFDMWERREAEYQWPAIDAPGVPDVDLYLQSIPEVRSGYWSEIESKPPAYGSLALAKAIQFSLRGKDLPEQKSIVADAIDELDFLARDVKEKRFAIKLDDESRLCGDVGGYTVTGEYQPVITMRLYDLAYSQISLVGERREDDGRRLSGPYYTPVVAIKSMAALARG